MFNSANDHKNTKAKSSDENKGISLIDGCSKFLFAH
jgi:hypothetical protein